MPRLIELASNLSPGQWVGVALLVLVAFLNRDQVAPAWAWLKGKAKMPTTRPTVPPDGKPTREQAFHAVDVLLAYFEAEKCPEGLAASRTAGAHLFHTPGEHV